MQNNELKECSKMLRKCPFCGGKAKLRCSVLVGFEAKNLYSVRCMECHVEPFESFSKEEAIKAWNTRKPMERIVERLAQQAKQYNRRAKELVNKSTEAGIHNKGKACSYEHAIEIVKEEGGMNEN